MYSYRIEQAIRAASILHHEQRRKGSMAFPYITHLVSVAISLLDYTTDEDTIVAALLHDTIEDTDYTYAELEEDFGPRVKGIVETLTEPKVDKNRPLTWSERKKTYAAQLKRGTNEAIMIAAADKAHNFRTTIEEYFDDYNRFIQDFGRNFDERIEVYQIISNVINNRLQGPQLAEFNHIFDEYKKFIYDIKKTEPISY